MMKNVAELNPKEAIDLIASTFFRVWGFVFAIDAFSSIWHLKSYYDYTSARGTTTPYDHHMLTNYSFDALFNVVIAALMFLVPTGLARLVTRGLTVALEKIPS